MYSELTLKCQLKIEKSKNSQKKKVNFEKLSCLIMNHFLIAF